MHPTRSILIFALLGGCGGGGLRTSEVDDLGGIRSATWIEWQRNQPGEDEIWHSFVLSSHGSLCKDLQETTPDLADAYDDLLDDLDQAQGDDEECQALERFYEDAAEITKDIYRRPLTTLALTLRDPDDDPEDPPPEDSYEQGVDDNDPWFLGDLTLTEANPYEELAAVANDCPGNLEEELVDALRDNRTRYTVDRGDVDAYERGDEAYRLMLDGDLEDDDGDDAGEIQARGTFRYCPVEWSGFFDPLDWGG